MRFKVCAACSNELRIDKFSKHKFNKDRLRRECKDCYNVRGRAYYKKNRVRIMRQHTAYQIKRAKEDPIFRLNRNFGKVLAWALGNNTQLWKWDKILGYTAVDLHVHLETQFKPPMTWENYGTAWHVDHIKPMSLFSFTSSDDPEFKACWSLENLQPLFVHENLTKGAKYEE